jgi:hypothetical protein
MRRSVQSGFSNVVRGYQRATSEGKTTYKTVMTQDAATYGLSQEDIIGLLDGATQPSTLAAKVSKTSLKKLISVLFPTK